MTYQMSSVTSSFDNQETVRTLIGYNQPWLYQTVEGCYLSTSQSIDGCTPSDCYCMALGNIMECQQSNPIMMSDNSLTHSDMTAFTEISCSKASSTAAPETDEDDSFSRCPPSYTEHMSRCSSNQNIPSTVEHCRSQLYDAKHYTLVVEDDVSLGRHSSVWQMVDRATQETDASIVFDNNVQSLSSSFVGRKTNTSQPTPSHAGRSNI